MKTLMKEMRGVDEKPRPPQDYYYYYLGRGCVKLSAQNVMFKNRRYILLLVAASSDLELKGKGET